MGRRLDVTGDDRDHLAVVGALALKNLSGLNLTAATPGATQPDWLQTPPNMGVSTPSEELDYLPLEPVDFTNSAIAAVPLDSQVQALPQRPFRGERLVLSAIYIAAAGGVTDALFRLLITPAIYVGAVQVGATQGSMPASAFAATAFGVRLSMPTAGQGTRIYVPFHFDNIGPGDRLIVAGGIFGRAVR